MSPLFNEGGGITDMLLLDPTEIAISGATALTGAAFGKMHVLSGSANYTVTLPAAAGNAGKVIGFRVAGWAAALVTLDGNASETIDGELARVMWAQESAILLCDGTGWTKIGGKSRPMSAVMRRATTQSIPNATLTQILVDQTDTDTGGLANLAGYSIDIRRGGQYEVHGLVYFGSGGVTPRNLCVVEIGASPDAARVGNRIIQVEQGSHDATTHAVPHETNLYDLIPGDRVFFYCYQNSGVSKGLIASTALSASKVGAREFVSW